ncbi:MAG TPA: Fe2+-dependent dioxygenase [Polyangia bacterium]|nr:Fe2+-dependent dioxygenase [Polyangia bacterium]
MSAIIIASAIPADVVAQIRAVMADGPFIDGKATAVSGAADLKDSRLLAPDSPACARALDLLASALEEHAGFQSAAWPEAMLPPHFCRYEVGRGYGDHVDAALMGERSSMIRCDVALTVCLNDGTEYEGGELIIDAAGLPSAWKGRAGDAIVYPANTLHRVAPITRGVRLVAVSWIQSMVRDPERRRVLHDLRSVLDTFDQGSAPAPGPSVETLRRCYLNLIRMWA